MMAPYRVLRGGGWMTLADTCEPAKRYDGKPNYRLSNLIGLRVVVKRRDA